MAFSRGKMLLELALKKKRKECERSDDVEMKILRTTPKVTAIDSIKAAAAEPMKTEEHASIVVVQAVNNGNPADREVDQAVNNGNPADLEVDQAVNNGNPADLEVDQAVNNGNPADLEVDQAVNNGNPADREVDQAVNNGNPADPEVDQAVNNGNPADLEVDQAVNHGYPADREVDQAVNNGNPADREVDQAVNNGNPAAREVDQAVNNGDRQGNNVLVGEKRPMGEETIKRGGKRSKPSPEEQKAKHPVREPCTARCPRKCVENISHERRQQIRDEFWTLDYNARRGFLFTYITRKHTEKICRKRKQDGDNPGQDGVNHRGDDDEATVNQAAEGGDHVSRRDYSFYYSLSDEHGDHKPVCKCFFLGTLGYHPKNDGAVTALMKSTPITAISPEGDRRGKHPKTSLIDREPIKDHIESYRPCISHYRREHAPNRRYLPSDITRKDMYEDFISKAAVKCSYQLYRTTVKERGISFTKLGEEQCEQCVLHETHENSHGSDDEKAACPECMKWEKHMKKANRARELYDEDAKKHDHGNEYSFRSVDLQKVIMLPRMPGLKTAVFTRRIIAFHETFASLGDGKRKAKKPSISVLWHEGIAGRSATEIAATFHASIKQERDVKHFIYWLDNCAGQNKNWTLFTMLTILLNSPDVDAEDVTLKFFEAGHTFMSADSIHAGVEKQFKKKAGGNVYDYNDFVDVVQKSNGGNIMVINLENEAFNAWKGLQSQAKLKHPDRPRLADIVEVRFCRGHTEMFYKTTHDGDYRIFDFLKKKAKIEIPGLLRQESRGISQEKKRDIISKLCPFMPNNRKIFWQELGGNDNVTDLTNEAPTFD